MPKNTNTPTPKPAARISAAISKRRPVADKRKQTKASAPTEPCLCGCGEHPSGKGRFRPGHDARLYSRILRSLRGKALVADPAITDAQWAWCEGAHDVTRPDAA